MTPDEFEDYTAFVLGQLDCFKAGVVSRNRRFNGVRQPGEYEVDIALNVKIDQAIDFFMIVECKNLSRPVDRPVVQKIEQTKQALSAHKAAIVSPLGFTKEAVDVARALGVALWVVAETTSSITIINGLGASAPTLRTKLERRQTELDDIGFISADATRSVNTSAPRSCYYPKLRLVLADFELSRASPVVETPFPLFCIRLISGPGATGESCRPGFDRQIAMTNIADTILGPAPAN